MDQLGIDIKLIAVQLVNFFILFIVLKKALYKPVIEYLNKREKTVKDNNNLKTKLESDELQLEETKVKTIKDSKKEAEKLINEAKLTAGSQRREAEKKAKEEAKRIIKNAKDKSKTLEDLNKAAKTKLVADVVNQTIKDMLADMITKKQREEITKAAINRL